MGEQEECQQDRRVLKREITSSESFARSKLVMTFFLVLFRFNPGYGSAEQTAPNKTT
jgi:hypothetical protein